MKRTTNKAQEAYMLAKANLDALEEVDDVQNTHVNFDIDESLLG
jgi:transcriptional/translational regulatory protein YebC/TACO1